MPPVHAHEHETDRPQHAEVLGHLRLAEAEPVDELADRRLPGAQRIEELPSARLGDGVEGICRRRCASHVTIIFRYRNMSTRHVIVTMNWVISAGEPGAPLVDPLAGAGARADDRGAPG